LFFLKRLHVKVLLSTSKVNIVLKEFKIWM